MTLQDRLGREIRAGDIVLWYAPTTEDFALPGLVSIKYLDPLRDGTFYIYMILLDSGASDTCYDSGYCRCLELLECS